MPIEYCASTATAAGRLIYNPLAFENKFKINARHGGEARNRTAVKTVTKFPAVAVLSVTLLLFSPRR
jgi:hypothetical protein